MSETTVSSHSGASLFSRVCCGYLQVASAARIIDLYRSEASPQSVWCLEAQQEWVRKVLLHPVLRDRPVRMSYAETVMRMIVREVEKSSEPRSELHDELAECYTALLGCREDADGWSYRHFWFGNGAPVVDSTAGWASFRVAPQFSNVGLALWPAAFVLARWVQQELEELAVGRGTEMLRRAFASLHSLRMVELGAGVGLTAAAVAPWADKGTVGCLYLTDYMPAIVENCRHNIDMLTSQSNSKVRCELLDWTEAEVNEHKLREWKCNVMLAADVIYAVDVLDALAATIGLFLLDADPLLPADRVCVLVSTRRNSATFDRFLELLPKECAVTTVPCPAMSAVDAFGGAWCGPFYVEMAEIVSIHVIRRGN